MEQLRVYPQSDEYVSGYHPEGVVSMFLAKYKTNCGYFELKVRSLNAFELYKGYYVSRIDEHFYPFKATISRNYSDLQVTLMLERSHCEWYSDLKIAVKQINILRTDYNSFMIIHQCVDNKNYLMLLTKKRTLIQDKIGIETAMIDVMKDYGIVIENITFFWSTDDVCERHLRDISEYFYRKIYFDRNQSKCPKELPVELIDLKDYWKNKTLYEEIMWEQNKTVMICTFIMVVGTVIVVGSVWIFLDNYKF